MPGVTLLKPSSGQNPSQQQHLHQFHPHQPSQLHTKTPLSTQHPLVFIKDVVPTIPVVVMEVVNPPFRQPSLPQTSAKTTILYLRARHHLSSDYFVQYSQRTSLALLHRYEDKNTPAPMKTYTSAITSLFSRPLSTSRAHAWDLFSHMRPVAHPEPDTLLYTLMIRACANPVSTKYPSEPERALDLWTEMTVDHKLVPTTGSYNAIILACAKSGTKTYVNEAFRLARQMLDSHRDAKGISPYRPDRSTFRALLEGTKRIGDLGRTGWILAEMVKLTNQSLEQEAVYGPQEPLIDVDIMTHVFHAYA
ncbi:hypothetical protein CVT24_009903, partial [Panaeolus cyanescens]